MSGQTLIATPEEGRALFDYQTRTMLGMSGDEFLRRWDAGAFRDMADEDQRRTVNRIVMMLPFVRRVPVERLTECPELF